MSRKYFSHCTITKLKKVKRCQRCNKKDLLYKHHKIPISKGGTLADEIVIFWNKTSKGTKFVIEYANARNKPIEVITK